MLRFNSGTQQHRRGDGTYAYSNEAFETSPEKETNRSSASQILMMDRQATSGVISMYTLAKLSSSNTSTIHFNDDETHLISRSPVPLSRKRPEAMSNPKLIKRTSKISNWSFDSDIGLKVGLGVCLFALLTNLSIVLVGAANYGGYKNGIGTLNRGRSDKIARLSTFYHILINTLSTGLLTSSNYCMQRLCAPTRKDIDDAHSHGKWLDIGILSFRNLWYISLRRSCLWIILACYCWARLSNPNCERYKANGVINKDWKYQYDTKYVPDAGNLWLVADQVSFQIGLNSGNLTWQCELPNKNTDYKWNALLPYPPVQLNVSVMLDTSTSGDGTSRTFYQLESGPAPQRLVYDISVYNSSSMPSFFWPDVMHFNAIEQSSWRDILAMNPDSWIFPPLHIGSAYSEPIDNGSSVQIALPFMVVVVICNALKAFAVFRTPRSPLSEQLIITQGDAISSFLQRPDWKTLGHCTLRKKDLSTQVKIQDDAQLEPWTAVRQPYGNYIHRRLTSNIFISTAVIIVLIAMIFSVALAKLPPVYGDSQGWYWRWGTSSYRQVPLSLQSFDTRGTLFNTWLANSPQILLSMSYFALNRLCTTICFVDEWNSHATVRKIFRATQPRGKQRPAYFLQLPYRWAIPLTIMSGVLHWLLSQSFFLVRLDIRDGDGGLIEGESKSSCGYSCLSLLVFSVTFIAMLAIVFLLLMRPLTMRIPPAEHCSLVISAACHPPPDDSDAHLKEVQWGVVRNRFGGAVQHCCFTSETVTPPIDGMVYS